MSRNPILYIALLLLCSGTGFAQLSPIDLGEEGTERILEIKAEVIVPLQLDWKDGTVTLDLDGDGGKSGMDRSPAEGDTATYISVSGDRDEVSRIRINLPENLRFKHSRDYDPVNPATYINASLTTLRQDRTTAGQQDCQLYIDIEPKSTDLYHRYGAYSCSFLVKIDYCDY